MEVWDGRSFGGNKKSKKQSIAEIKQEYTIDRVLGMLAGRPVLGVRPDLRSSRDWSSIPCPLHEDRKPSASINLGKGRFHCHSCSVSGDIFDVVQQVIGVTSIQEARDWITSKG